MAWDPFEEFRRLQAEEVNVEMAVAREAETTARAISAAVAREEELRAQAERQYARQVQGEINYAVDLAKTRNVGRIGITEWIKTIPNPKAGTGREVTETHKGWALPDHPKLRYYPEEQLSLSDGGRIFYTRDAYHKTPFSRLPVRKGKRLDFHREAYMRVLTTTNDTRYVDIDTIRACVARFVNEIDPPAS